MATPETASTTDFIREVVAGDLKSGKHGGRVVTRFPPEPNGFPHIGHAKSICLNFGIAQEFAGRCHLRMDDTNPETEEARFVAAFQQDVRWLGFDWGEHFYHASDYFERLYDLAVELVKKGKAFVCSLSDEEIRAYRGTVTEPGRFSPYRDRSVEESLDLLARMRAGEFPDGAHTLRARIGMSSPNMKMRDPLMYRIRHAAHYRRDGWSIYPMYDWAHGQSDWIEGITHSICTLEFENNRELYDWFLEALGATDRPQQIEFARLELSHTVLSKRKLQRLVEARLVRGWDDPRMPTLAGLRRRGVTPAAIRDFCQRIGVARRDSLVDKAQLDHCIREDLNRQARRLMAVLRPLRVVIDNYPDGLVEELEAVNNPEDAAAGTRRIPFAREIYIERDDFREDPPSKYHRLAPGREVRLKHAYFIRCERVEREAGTGEPACLHCTYDPATRGGAAPDGRSPKGTLHWVSAAHAVQAEVRLYDHLFATENPDLIGDDLETHLNPASLAVLTGCRVEPAAAAASPGEGCQFLRHGYFTRDPDPGLVFNRTVALRDTWAKIERSGTGPA